MLEGPHCGFRVLYLPLLVHLIPVQRLPGSQSTVIIGLGALSPSKAQAALCFQVGTSTNQTSNAFYVTAYALVPLSWPLPLQSGSEGPSRENCLTQVTPKPFFGPLNFPLKMAKYRQKGATTVHDEPS